MAKKLYLISGESSTGRLKAIDGKALAESENGNVLVLNLTSDDFEKSQTKGNFFKNYFKEVGAESVELVGKETPDEKVREYIESAGLIYLPGGNTKTLIDNLRNKDLVSQLESFDGIIAGNSAGTYAMCPDYLKIGRGEAEIIPAFGFVNFWTKAHYEPKFDSDLEKLSEGRIIYALENESAIVVGDDLGFIGNVWKFSEGRKERVI
jgi:cyanophycinase-like exopeptidase